MSPSLPCSILIGWPFTESCCLLRFPAAWSCSPSTSSAMLTPSPEKFSTAQSAACCLRPVCCHFICHASNCSAGALLQRYTASEGGLRITQAVSAEGFLDQRRNPWLFNNDCGYACVTPLIRGTYRYLEFAVDDERGRFLLVFIADRPNENCWDDRKEWSAPVKPDFHSTARPGEGRCLAFQLTGKRTARYEVRNSRDSVDAAFGLFPLRKETRQVIRLADRQTVAEANYFKFYSRLFGGSFGEVEPWDEFLAKALPASPRRD